MAGAEGVVLALLARQKAAQAAELANRRETIAPAADELVGVGLVAGVPNDAILRRVEHIVQRQRQLHRAQGRSKVTAHFRHHRDHFLANLLGQLRQLVESKLAHIARIIDAI